MAIEEPAYKTILKRGAFELRHYEQMLIAEVSVSGDLKEASSAGFRMLADYIFGNNITKDGSPEKIAMTAPVMVKPEGNESYVSSHRLIKTEPGQWLVQFTMPSHFSINTIPKPHNSEVMVKVREARKVAVLVFSGLASEKSIKSKLYELEQWLQSNHIKHRSDTVELARYNPPWTLPFLRRNELIIEVD